MHNFVGQVLVVRQDLKMGSGKIASQCARKLFQIINGCRCFYWFRSVSDSFHFCSVFWLIASSADAATGMYADLVQRCISYLITLWSMPLLKFLNWCFQPWQLLFSCIACVHITWWRDVKLCRTDACLFICICLVTMNFNCDFLYGDVKLGMHKFYELTSLLMQQ